MGHQRCVPFFTKLRRTGRRASYPHRHTKTLSRLLFSMEKLPYRLAFSMPFYAQLDIVIPSFRAAQKALEEFQPDAIHVSTPGPMGLIGRHLALKYNLPLVGVYHTDFPSYAAKNLPWLPSAFLALSLIHI